jgi:tetratricopeptide (TPR) repeat protein
VTAPRTATAPRAPGPGKRRVFTALIIAFPFLLLTGTELTLRVMDYGGNLELVLRSTVPGKDVLTLNRDAARRYFAGSVSGIPELADDRFDAIKGKKTLRIFCLGESTMQGFPYEYHATAPAFLRDRLQAMFPQYTIEVVNAGLSAVGSVVVEDFTSELARYEPDLFLLYLGHNEFYGVYGAGSAVGAGSGWMTRLAVSLLRFRTYLLLRDGYLWARNSTSAARPGTRGSLMGQMVGNTTIPYDGELYREARGIYARNLHAIIRTAKSRGIPIMFSTLVSNIRDQQPFVSAFSEGTGAAQQAEWKSLTARGDSLHASGDLTGAAAAYSGAVRIDTMHALAFFRLGRTLLEEGRYGEAKAALGRARDLDALRFRASDDFQQVLLDVCRDEGVPAARVDSAFDAASPHGIVGSTLILEHLHPNIEGYFLMARVWVEALREQHLLFSPDEWRNARNPTDSALMALSTVSEFDRTAGRIKVDLLMHRWPFTAESGAGTFTPATDIEALVYRYVRGQIPWSEARYALAELFASRGKFEEARTECRAVARILPYSYQPLFRIAGLYTRGGDRARAIETYRASIAVEDNPFSRMNLALILLEQKQPGPAAAEIERALALVAEGKYRMSVEAVAAAQYLLGAALAQLGRYDEAREHLQLALAMKPDLPEARELLKQMETPGSSTRH